MNDRDILDEEPPPSYEEATGRPSITYRPTQNGPSPPTLPPRPANHKINTNTTIPNGPGTPGGPASPTITPHTPAQTFQQILPVSQQATARQFPPAFNLYRDAFPGGPRSYFLGEHQVSPLYSVTAGWTAASSGSSLVIHNGPSDDHAPLATVAYDLTGRHLRVTLPPLPGRNRAEPVELQTPTFMSVKFAFTVEVTWPGGPGGAAYRKESFEWRRSNSLAIGGLGGRSQGWKLVRLSNELPPGGLAVSGSGPPAGDGHEVVAVCTDAVMSMTKLFKFSFLGTGLSGALGERWAVMAVTTGLVIWDQERRRD